jgi:very-short-patch-repair endonuclease
MAPASDTDQSTGARLVEGPPDAKPKLRKLKFARNGAPGEPSPLAGEGGSSHSEEPGEGARVRRQRSKRIVSEQTVFARNLRLNATDAERKLWSILRQPPFSRAKFRRQVPVGPFVADFLSYSERLIVEADGGQHNDSASDRRRDAWLRRNGFRALRFWNSDVLTNTESVLTALLNHIDYEEDQR